MERRHFLKRSVAGVTGVTLVPHLYVSGRSPNDTVRLGFIGVGRRGINLVKAFLGIEGVEVLAASDVYGIKRKRFEKLVSDCYSDSKRKPEIKTDENYHDLLSRTDIDAVVIVMPDH